PDAAARVLGRRCNGLGPRGTVDRRRPVVLRAGSGVAALAGAPRRQVSALPPRSASIDSMSTKKAAPGLQCPRCINSRMLEQTWNGVKLSICMACGANFFHAGDLAAWEGWSRDIPVAAERHALRRPGKVLCPADSATMER